MSVLTHSKIIEEINKRNIQITPYDENKIGPGSIDLTLGDTLKIFDGQNIYREIVITKDKPYLIKSKEMVLGVTSEKVSLSSSFCAWIEGRSKYARLGLAVHVSSGFIQPGTANHQVLEIVNLSPNQINLTPGLRICQIIIERCEGEATYSGKFKDQVKP